MYCGKPYNNAGPDAFADDSETMPEIFAREAFHETSVAIQDNGMKAPKSAIATSLRPAPFYHLMEFFFLYCGFRLHSEEKDPASAALHNGHREAL